MLVDRAYDRLANELPTALDTGELFGMSDVDMVVILDSTNVLPRLISNVWEYIEDTGKYFVRLVKGSIDITIKCVSPIGVVKGLRSYNGSRPKLCIVNLDVELLTKIDASILTENFYKACLPALSPLESKVVVIKDPHNVTDFKEWYLNWKKGINVKS